MNIVKSGTNFKSGLTYNNNPDTIILHHPAAVSCTVEDIDRWHKNRGWSGIGYHYYVRKDGTVYTGRHENAQGAHCKGYNTHSIAICAEGDYSKETEMPEAQKNSVISLIKDIKTRHTIKKIKGHIEVYPTSCPGQYYPLDEIKAAAESGNAVKEETVSTHTNTTVPTTTSSQRTWLQVGDRGDAVLALQTALKRLGFYKGSLDGIYGGGTKQAVIEFQRIMGLKADGLAGKQTQAAISEILSKPVLSLLRKRYEYATRFVQYKVGSGIDSYFGKNTNTKVKQWQKGHGLSGDGIVGKATWASMIS